MNEEVRKTSDEEREIMQAISDARIAYTQDDEPTEAVLAQRRHRFAEAIQMGLMSESPDLLTFALSSLLLANELNLEKAMQRKVKGES